MSINFRDLAPALDAPLESVGRIGLIKELNETAWFFAIIETAHLLFLVVLGGAVLVLNLRLLGVLLKEVPAQTVERATRSWLRTGIVGTIVTGTYMGIATVVTLLPSGAFFVKMVSLVAAIVLSSAVARRVREGSDAAGSRGELVRAGVAIALWLAALALFAGTSGLSAGAVLVGLVGFALVGATGIVQHRRGDAWLLSPERIGALSSLLAWITVAAAGRWIGFS